MSTEADLIETFIARAPSAKASVLTLAGTGPNGSSQLPVLIRLGRDQINALTQINVISGSCVSYFIFMAMQEGGLNPDGFREYDKRVRQLHKGSLGRLVYHVLTRRYKSSAFFPNELLNDTLAIFLESSFLTRPLHSFAGNVRFYAYCLAKGEVIELSAKTQPHMTVSDIFRACISIPLLHGPFAYQDHTLVDPTFTPGFTPLRRRLFSTGGNHLYVNLKKQGEFRNILFVKNEPLRFPNLQMVMDFLWLCSGIPNRRVNRTHAAHLQAFSAATRSSSQVHTSLDCQAPARSE